jgi:hypothetical protein
VFKVVILASPDNVRGACMIAETVVFQGLRMVSAALDDVPHRRRNASYPEALKNAIRIHT